MGMAVFLWAVFSPGLGGLLWGAEEKAREAGPFLTEEKEKAVNESILKAKKKMLTGVTEVKKEEAGKAEEAPKLQSVKEEPVFFLAEDIRWEGNQDNASLVITGEEETLPEGSLDTGLGGMSVRWRPEQALVVKKKKDNPVESPFLQRVVFREDVAMTKKLGLEAPYYALSEIVLIFSSAASYNVTQEGAWISIDFSVAKKAALPEDLEAKIRKQLEVAMPSMSSVADLLGNQFQAKEQYEAFLLGGGKTAEIMKKLTAEKRPTVGLFDGRGGFPQDMSPVFQEAYPAFGTKEYWKRHLRAVARQTFGYSSDFDGTYGAAGVSTKDKAFTLQPDVNIAYNGLGFGRTGTQKPTGSLDLGYSAARMLPLGSRDLSFGDGARLQTVNWGGTYSPKERYSLSCQNNLGLFASKTVGKSNGDWVRQPRRGYMMTNAAGINYRLTRRLLWKNGVGLSGTRSIAPEGVSRDLAGYLNTGLTQAISRRVSLDADYSYRHLFYDEDPDDNPSPNTKGKDIHSMSMDLGYRMPHKLRLNCGPELSIIEGPPPYGDIFAFGGRAKMQYQWSPKDSFEAVYGNGMIQDGTGKVMSGILGRNPRDTKITLRRGSRIGVSYRHAFETSALSLSLTYRRLLPLDGIFPREKTKTDFITFEASWRRKIRRGRSWLELKYTYGNWLSRGIDPRDENTTSVNEHAVLLTFGNYFGA